MRIFLLLVLAGLVSCKEKKDFSKHEALAGIEDSSIVLLFEDGFLKKGEILWKPDSFEKEAFSDYISDDGFCHTQIDTTLKLGNKSFVVFQTYRYEGEARSDCHGCAPMMGMASFEKRKGGYKLLNFKKDVVVAGNYGEAAVVSLDRLWVDALRVQDGMTGQGIVVENESYYDLGNFGKLMGISTYESNEGMYGEGETGPDYYQRTKAVTDKTDSSIVIETVEISVDSENVIHEKKHSSLVKQTKHGRSATVNKSTTRIVESFERQ